MNSIKNKVVHSFMLNFYVVKIIKNIPTGDVNFFKTLELTKCCSKILYFVAFSVSQFVELTCSDSIWQTNNWAMVRALFSSLLTCVRHEHYSIIEKTSI